MIHFSIPASHFSGEASVPILKLTDRKDNMEAGQCCQLDNAA